VTTQARRYLAELERERDALRSFNSPQGELALFPPPPPAAPMVPPVQAATSLPAALLELRATDPDTLSPRAALDLVFRLKELDANQAS
jgi:hypothetical protein